MYCRGCSYSIEWCVPVCERAVWESVCVRMCKLCEIRASVLDPLCLQVLSLTGVSTPEAKWV